MGACSCWEHVAVGSLTICVALTNDLLLVSLLQLEGKRFYKVGKMCAGAIASLVIIEDRL